MVIAATPSKANSVDSRNLDKSKVNKALDSALDMGATYAEVRLVSLSTGTASLRDGSLHRAVPGQEIAATLRILSNGSWGVHSTTDIQSISQQIEPTFRLANAVASRRDKSHKSITLAEVPIIEDELHWKPKKDVRDIQLETRIELMNQVHQEANDHQNIISVQCGWSDEHIHTELMTSEGMDRTWSFQRIMTNVMVTARDEKEVVSYRMRHGGEGGLDLLESVDLGEMGRTCRVSALRLLGAKRAPSGRMPLVADRDLTGVYIHEALGHPCEADLVAAGDSCLEGKLGQKIGSELITVVDDPLMRGGYGAYPIDDEGLDTKKKLLIKNGVLNEYLNHRETAGYFDLEPNAGARAQDGLHHPLVRMSNTMVLGGNHHDLDDLIADIPHGIYACGSRGGQVDTGRGSFQFAAQEAWLIENGELTSPLKDVSVSGLTLEILKNVDGLTKDAKLASPGFCGKGQTVPVGDGGPLMRIKDALVG